MDDVNIIVFRQINQFDLSGNVITSSEYLSTLWVRVLKKTQSPRERWLSSLTLALVCYEVTPGLGAEYQVMGESLDWDVKVVSPHSAWQPAVEQYEGSAQWSAHGRVQCTPCSSFS